jgi:hypothetical protein
MPNLALQVPSQFSRVLTRSKVMMERYTVTVAPSGVETFRLLIPFSPTSSVSALATEVKRRISRLDVWPDVPDIALRLGQADGPILDEDDTLADVLPSPNVEIITATSQIRKSTPVCLKSDDVSSTSSEALPRASTNQEVKLRVITPALARAHKDVHTIPILRDATITSSSTLREVKAQISEHLCIHALDILHTDQECNCSFARQINERGLMNEASPLGTDNNLLNPTSKFVIVYGRSKVHLLETESADKSSILETVHQGLGYDIASKNISFIGGTLLPNTRQAPHSHQSMNFH